ncbi:MAG: DUF861 domain-containing protein [Rhizobiales bacterium]|nr:DUF861 domain-containing protein [Hyphomicrobiales bacterium]
MSMPATAPASSPAAVRSIAKVAPKGPGGRLEDWGPWDPATLIAGEGRQKGYMIHEDEAEGLSVGVWHASPMTGRREPWSSEEFMILLEGGVTVETGPGIAESYRAGECFHIPRGRAAAWQQTGPIAKVFFIWKPVGAAPVAAPAMPLRIDTKTPLADDETIDPKIFIRVPEWQRSVGLYDSPCGRLSIGLWQSAPMQRTEASFSRNELMHILEGEVTLFDGRGGEWTAGPGETLFAPRGCSYGWRSSVPVKKIYCILA